jgi:hypothetical protein
MNWFPYTGVIPTLGLVWPTGIATTSLTVAALIACIRLTVLAVHAVRDRARTVSVPYESPDLIDDEEVTRSAA